MLEHLRAPFKRLIAPIARLLAGLGVTADMVTVVGALGTTVVAIVTGVTGWLLPGAIVLTVLVVFDSLDGSVAAITSGGTPFGAFLDSTLDRIADWAVLLAVVLFFYLHHDWWYDAGAHAGPDYIGIIGILAALYAIMTSFVTSYTRARAESVGYEAKNGIATRSDRLVVILVGMALAGALHNGIVLMVAMLILAVLGTITVFQRVMTVHGQMARDGATEATARETGTDPVRPAPVTRRVRTTDARRR
jgi:CDP-diacylglycerol--glycerol-3-phosphate 3-phosphatidyltransferase